MMKRTSVVCVVAVLLMASVSSAAIRFHGSGSWDMLEGVGQAEGWQSAVAPGSLDTVRANWGGSTVTLNYETTVKNFELGVDESGTFEIQNGGILNTAGTNSVGKTGRDGNGESGTLNVLTGGTVNNSSWLKIGNDLNADGFMTVTGTVNIQSHLWVAAGSGSTGTVIIDDGGIVRTIGGNLGIGTGNASTASGGNGSITVNSGGLLDLWQWSSTTSIFAGSVLNINDGGTVIIHGNRGTQADAYFALGLIASDLGAIQSVYDEAGDYTTITAVPEPATMLLLGLGGLLIRNRR